MAKSNNKCSKKVGVTNSKLKELMSPKQAWLVAFVLVAVMELVFIAMHVLSSVVIITNWVLAPLLAIWVWQSRGPKLLVLALEFCWLGDVLGNPRAIGIGQIGVVASAAAFAAAGMLLTALFIRRGALNALRESGARRGRFVGAVAVCLAATTIGVLFAWSGLSIVFRVAVSIYLFLFAALAAFAASAGIIPAIGAAMLLGAEILPSWKLRADSMARRRRTGSPSSHCTCSVSC